MNLERTVPETFDAAWRHWWDAQTGADLEPLDLARLFWNLGVAEGIRCTQAALEKIASCRHVGRPGNPECGACIAEEALEARKEGRFVKPCNEDGQATIYHGDC